jgi:PQQ-dependent dehydrogenase (methanol/ethanol family)
MVAISRALAAPWAAAGANPSEWSLLGGGAEAQQFSPLSQIKTSNVASLGLVRYAELPIKEGLVGNVLIKDGIAYQSTPRGGALAVNLADAKVVWTFEPVIDYTNNTVLSMWTSHNTRGLGMDAENVYTANGCYLFAVNRANGQQVWKARTCDPTGNYGNSAAPRVGGGKVFVGIATGEAPGARGYAAAFDAKSGKELWRFYTMPGDPSKPFENPQMETASKSWGADYATKGGAAGVWEGMIYDPETDLLIFGTGNPGSHDSAWLAAHQDLYSDSIVAVNASTGQYAWHYQALPGDAWGMSDCAGPLMLASLNLPGGKRRVVMSAEKQLFYVLDAKTGAFISASAYVPNTNFSSIDPETGKLTVREELKVWDHPGTSAILQPGDAGGHGWTLMAYNPETGLVYIPAYIFPGELGDHASRSPKNERLKAQGRLVAWDPVAKKERWHVDNHNVLNGGVLTTAGGLVFQGTVEGEFYAYDARTGQQVWHFQTHSIIEAGPSTVTLNGKQLIVVPAGDASANGTVRYFPAYATDPKTLMAPSRLLIFGIKGKEVLPPSPPKKLPKPAREKPAATLAAAGAAVFAQKQCSLCHSSSLQISGQGRIPDLRTITAGQLDAMSVILREGLLVPLGMPRFKDTSDDDIKALQAYIMDRAWHDYDEQHQAHASVH